MAVKKIKPGKAEAGTPAKSAKAVIGEHQHKNCQKISALPVIFTGQQQRETYYSALYYSEKQDNIKKVKVDTHSWLNLSVKLINGYQSKKTPAVLTF